MDEILNLIESVSEGFPSYFFICFMFGADLILQNGFHLNTSVCPIFFNSV